MVSKSIMPLYCRSGFLSVLLLVILVDAFCSQIEATDDESSSVLLAENVKGLDLFKDDSNLYYWTTHYLDEYDELNYKTILKEPTLDRRLANIIFTQEVYKFTSTHANSFKNNSATLEEYNRFINGPEVSQDLCKLHLQLMSELLHELAHINDNHRNKKNSPLNMDQRHIHLARVMDSYGRYMSGSLVGRSRMLGSSSECLETKLLLGPKENQQVVGTRVCSAQLGISAHLEPKLRQHSGQVDSYIELGICLPNTCHSGSLTDNKQIIQELINSQFRLPETIYVEEHREIKGLFCLNEGNRSLGLPTSGRVLIWLMCVWVVTILLVTYYSDLLVLSGGKLGRTLTQFMDLKKLLLQLVGPKRSSREISSNSRVDLDTLDVVKFVSLYMVVVGHALLLHVNYGPDLHKSYAGLQREVFSAWIAGRPFYVDTFFVISGLLLAFGTLQRVKPTLIQSFFGYASTCFCITFIRYLRLVPLYFLLIWFKKSVWLYAGSGILWPKVFNQESLYGACKLETWLTPFAPIAAHTPLGRQCLPQGWSVGCELVFAIISPPLILGLIKKPRLSITILALLGSMSAIWMYWASMTLDPNEMKIMKRAKGDMGFVLAGSNSIVYSASHLRLGPLTYGAILGYFLHLFNGRKINQWPQWVKNHATKLAFAGMILIELSFASIPYLHTYVMPYIALQDKLLHVLLLGRVIWFLSNGIIILRMTTDWKDVFFFKVVRGNLLRSISKICFAVVLIHVDVIAFELYTIGNTMGSSTYAAISLGSSAFLHSIVLGAVVHVIFESPMHALMTTLLKSYNSSQIKSSKHKRQ